MSSPRLPLNSVINTTPSEAVFGTDQTITGSLEGDLMRIRTPADADRVRNNLIYGYDGDDTIRAGEGNDWVAGGEGNDVLTDRGGADHLFGEAGNDSMHGRGKADWLDGGEGNDHLTGAGGADTMLGGNGNDTMLGGWGRDTILGGSGSDEIAGHSGRDSIDGGGGSDILKGGDDVDTIFGSRGDDTITGGKGGDILIGGDGADVFVFTSAEDSTPGRVKRDKLFDQLRATSDDVDVPAKALESDDRIDLSAIDADMTQAGKQTLVWGDVHDGGDRAIGTVYLVEKGTDTLVVVNLDEHDAWDFRIEIEDGDRSADWYGAYLFLL